MSSTDREEFGRRREALEEMKRFGRTPSFAFLRETLRIARKAETPSVAMDGLRMQIRRLLPSRTRKVA